MKDRRSKGRWMKGSSAVEFALTLPIFIILVIGIIEFGWYFFVQHTLQYATREGMRLALVGRTINNPSGTPMSREDSIITTIRNNATLAVKPASVSVFIYEVFPAAGYVDPTGWANLSPNAGGSGEYMRVRSRYNHTFFTPLIGGFFSGGGIVIQAEGTYRNEVFD
jgi:Flp pilus assembly protein TadG